MAKMINTNHILRKNAAIGFFLLLLTFLPLNGQTIQFSVHVSSSLDATKDQDMTFETVYSGSGTTQINLGDPGMGVFAITGNEDMDVIVTLTPPSHLTSSTTTHSIPLTMQFAYNNRGSNDVNQAVVVSGGIARFQLRERESGPAGVPPTPPSSGYSETQATAYLYVYGSMNVGPINAGTYTGVVDLSVVYD